MLARANAIEIPTQQTNCTYIYKQTMKLCWL